MKSNDECIDIKITPNRMQHIKDEKTKKELLEPRRNEIKSKQNKIGK